MCNILAVLLVLLIGGEVWVAPTTVSVPTAEFVLEWGEGTGLSNVLEVRADYGGLSLEGNTRVLPGGGLWIAIGWRLADSYEPLFAFEAEDHPIKFRFYRSGNDFTIIVQDLETSQILLWEHRQTALGSQYVSNITVFKTCWMVDDERTATVRVLFPLQSYLGAPVQTEDCEDVRSAWRGDLVTFGYHYVFLPLIRR